MKGRIEIIDNYRGVDIVLVNANNPFSRYFSVVIKKQLSCISLISVQACKNVIDTYIKYNGQAPNTL